MGLLLRARRYKLLTFEGEILFQGKDDFTKIKMLRTFYEIHGFYKVGEHFIDIYLFLKLVDIHMRNFINNKYIINVQCMF